MAGSELAISTNKSESENPAQNPQISATIDQWEVQYGRFVNFSSSTVRLTHPSLAIPKIRLGRGIWISAAAASLKLNYQQSFNGLYDASIVISLRSRVLEEHYISRVCFSWPQVSCVSGFPAKGSKVVLVSYKDGVGQKQKFALRFSDIYEAEKFMNLVKEILENGNRPLLECPEYNCVLSSEAEVISSDGPTYRIEGDLQSTTSVDHSTQPIIPSPEPYLIQYSSSHEMIEDYEDSEAMSAFPPSFTQLLKNCHPEVSQVKPKEPAEDLTSQFMRYLEETSFTELLANVENIVSELGDVEML
ncbi:hypothetical protein ABFS82_05G018900 [Erythranthe guttata]|uniref:uncharacterized protein LOC105974814 isoform X2 n=1 Tax=Erythranthe guttata TaxID=4155 RepID=UPI00064E05A5|nr:PREDICTED: uncharacterized protein LOC105974814 isoform X2 [Erythranthe guttata]|eukprot:XP_012855429.1 PREDICTED: uncharacterized protein LOC105974814 isoform X2 [Erythranthe guttata]